MFQERKRISIKDLNLKIGDKVVGMHVDKSHLSYTTVAGEIKRIDKLNDGTVTYHVRGKAYLRPFSEPAYLSGDLEENEVEVIDQGMCNTIMEMFDLANDQLSAGSRDMGTVEEIREMRHRARQELEEKYPVVEA